MKNVIRRLLPSVGTRSLLFGAHQFLLHPFFVFRAWWRLWGLPLDPRIYVAFLVHDWGYWNCKTIDGADGKRHPELAARIMAALFDVDDSCPGENGLFLELIATVCDQLWGYRPEGMSWGDFTILHSRTCARKLHAHYSRLCVADKMVTAVTPSWLYLPLVELTGEIDEYIENARHADPKSGFRAGDYSNDHVGWFREMRQYYGTWALQHREGQEDGTADLATV